MTGFSFDATAANFAQTVLDASQRQPVLVDFWAPWCAPCRALKPILEKLAAEYRGKFLLAKVNSDENQELAMQFGVRGIPNVKAFVNGRLADEFSGALPEYAVREFIEGLLPSPAAELAAQAADAHAAGDAEKALRLLEQALQLEPANESVRIGAAQILLDSGKSEEAGKLLAELSAAARQQPRAAALLARIEFAQSGTGDAAALRARIAANGSDLDARLQLARLCVAQQDYEEALGQLLEIVRTDRKFGDDIGRRTMLTVFNLLGGEGELVSRYRRLLASALN